MVKGNQAGRQPQDYSLDSDSEGKELISRSPSPSEEDSEIKYYEERRYRRLPRSQRIPQPIDYGPKKRIKGWVKNQRAKNRKRWVVNKLAKINQKRLRENYFLRKMIRRKVSRAKAQGRAEEKEKAYKMIKEIQTPKEELLFKANCMLSELIREYRKDKQMIR